MAQLIIPEDIQELIKMHGIEITLQEGEVLFQQDTLSDAVYLVTSGKLVVLNENTASGATVLLNHILPGQIAGEIGTITGWPRTATLKAERTTTLVKLTAPQFTEVLRKAPVLAKLAMGAAGSYLITADTERVNLGRGYQQMRMRVSTLDKQREQLQELLRLREEMEELLVHDLRNPLNILQTGITLLQPLVKDTPEQQTADTILELMTNATYRMQYLIETLLDIAKMEAGQSSLELSEFNLIALLSNLYHEQRPPFQEKNIAFELEVPLEINIEGDRNVLYRVVVNLVDNALKFTPKGGNVTLTAQEIDAEWVEVIVSDSGPGIPIQERKRIFEKFTQIKSPNTASARRGSGLGLTFCKMAVEAHGGVIHAEDGPDGRGVTFHVRLPRKITKE